jgi:thymidine kinase
VTWECAECHVAEVATDKRTRVDAVCHHCGKPLCRDDRLLVPDHAFDPGPGDIGADAVHCPSCKRRFHGADISIGVTEHDRGGDIPDPDTSRDGHGP